MKTTIKLFTLLATVLCLAACNKENERDITYTVDENTTTVHLDNDAEWDALLDRFCDYAESGSAVTFHNANSVAEHSSKEANSFTTTNREEMKTWMRRMEDEGKTVTVTYDPSTGIWHGTAYTTGASSSGNTKRLSRVTMTKSCVSGFHLFGLCRPEYENYYGLHTVYNYTWNGNNLASVDMNEETIVYMPDGITVDSIIHVSNIATFDYAGAYRTAMYLYDDNNNLVKEFQYVYDNNGHLAQEFQTDHAYDVYHVHYYHYKEFMGLDWYFDAHNPTFIFRGTFGVDFHYDSVGNYCGTTYSNQNITDYPNSFSDIIDWTNGDLVSRTSSYGNLLMACQYDNAPQPYGIATGTTSLLPGYNTFIQRETYWSQHNLTHFYAQWAEMWFSNTYNSDGSIATAQTTWIDGSTIQWTFEYLD